MINKDIHLKDKFRVLAGITKDDTLATLYIPKANVTIELKYIPKWFEKLKYKICGFQYTFLRLEPFCKDNIKVTEKSVELVIG
jgi:hypothetical protein